MELYEQQNVGNPTISQLLEILSSVKEEVGDVKVCAAYDGNWNMPVIIQRLDDRIIIGSIS